MTDQAQVVDIENEKEWRRFLVDKVMSIEKNQNKFNVTLSNLALKVYFLAFSFGVVGGFIQKYLFKKIIN